MVERNFSINDHEALQIEQWEKKHNKVCPIILEHRKLTGEGFETYPAFGAINAGHSYTFTPSGIGTFITIKCPCGANLKVDSNL